MIFFASLLILSLLLLLMISEIALLFRYITYPYGDACAFLEYAGSLRGVNVFDKNFAQVGPTKTYIDFFQEKKYFTVYNIFLNMIKLFPAQNRFRNAQLLNLALHLFCVCLVGIIIFITCNRYSLNPDYSIPAATIFALLFGIRSKLLFSVFLVCSDIVNHLLLLLLLLVLLVAPTDSIVSFSIFGVLTGLSARNRPSDLVIFLSCLTYLFFISNNWTGYCVYIFSFFTVLADIIYIHIFHSNKITQSLRSIWKTETPIRNETCLNLKFHVTFFLESFCKMFLFYKEDSLWPSLGSSVLLLPFSIAILHGHPETDTIFLFFAIYSFFHIAALSLVRTNLTNNNKTNKAYFGKRQMYIIFPLIVIVNGIAFSYALSQKHLGFMFIFLLWIFCYVVHQLYRLLDYYFSETIFEIGLSFYKKSPDTFRIDLSNFIESLKKPAVIMGYYLKWGEVFGHFQCSSNLKCVSVIKKINDTDLLQLIKTYHVTHIIITPMSDFIGKDCSLRNRRLNKQLQHILKRYDFTEQLTIYEVVCFPSS